MNPKQQAFFRSYIKGALAGFGGALVGFAVFNLLFGDIGVRKLTITESIITIFFGITIVLIAHFTFKNADKNFGTKPDR